MKKDHNFLRNLVFLDYMKENTDKDHTVSVYDIQEYLKDAGYSADRRTIYTMIEDINQRRKQIVYLPASRGYYMEHSLTPAEAYVITDALNSAPSLSPKTTAKLNDKILRELSIHQRMSLPAGASLENKSENEHVIEYIELLLQAVQEGIPVEFQYYDITVTKTRKYRHNSRKYVLVPYGITMQNGRYYCVMYDEKYRNFAAYRIDKMDHIQLTGNRPELVPFDLERWLISAFHMYKGEAETITVRFDLSVANQVFDQFGNDLIIHSVDSSSFTASIRTGTSVTLIAWLLQFYRQATVLRPQSLINAILEIADTLKETYAKENNHG